MRARDVLAVDTDHRRRVNAVGLPETGSGAGLVGNAERIVSAVPLLGVHAGLHHEVRDIGSRIFVLMRLVNDGLKELHMKLRQQAERLERVVGLHKRIQAGVPGNRIHLEVDPGGELLRPGLDDRIKAEAVRAGIGEEVHDFNLLTLHRHNGTNHRVFLAFHRCGRSSKRRQRKRGKRGGRESQKVSA